MSNVDEKNLEEGKPSKKPLFFCCCCSAIIFIAIIIGIIAAILCFPEYDPENPINRDDKPANLSPAFFLNSMPPDYSINEQDEAEFNDLLVENFDESELENVTAMVTKLDEKYPEGYFVIVTQTLSQPDEFKNWYELTAVIRPITMDIIVHEMTHTGGFYNCTFFIEDKCITIQDQWSLSEELFSGDNLLSYITEQNSTDESYLVENKHNIIGTLDEVNAYIKSVRISRAYNQHDSYPASLARQMYYITLHLRHAKEIEIDDWNALVDNRGFAYTLMRLMAMAEAELETAEGKWFSDIDVTENLRLYEENKKYLDEFFVSTEVDELNDLDLTYTELQERGVLFGLEEM